MPGAPDAIGKTLRQWSDEFILWRKNNAIEIINGSKDFREKHMEPATLIAYLISITDKTKTLMPTYKNHDDIQFVPSVKNQYIANNLHLYYPIATNYDAWVRTYPGQNVWRVSWSSFQGRNLHIAIINPMMMVWGASAKSFFPSKWPFPVTTIYAIAQEVWTGDVQRGRRKMLTFFGKGCNRPEAAAVLITPTGEDSGSFLVLQDKEPDIESTQIDWFIFDWARPTIHDTSLAATEMRYAYNVTRFLMDRNQFAVFFNQDLPADKKLSHLFLWLHYFSSVFALALLIILPALAPFSAFAFLKPMTFFIVATFAFMEAINSGNIIRHWRQSASLWKAIILTARDTVVAFPFYVPLIVMFLKGVWYASNEIFSFISTIKKTQLTSYVRVWYFANSMMFYLFGFKNGIPLNGLIALAGMLGFGIGLFFMTSIGPLVLIPYLFASISFLVGMRVFNAFVDRKGNLKGTGFLQMFTQLPLMIWMTILTSISGILFKIIFSCYRQPIKSIISDPAIKNKIKAANDGQNSTLVINGDVWKNLPKGLLSRFYRLICVSEDVSKKILFDAVVARQREIDELKAKFTDTKESLSVRIASIKPLGRIIDIKDLEDLINALSDVEDGQFKGLAAKALDEIKRNNRVVHQLL